MRGAKARTVRQWRFSAKPPGEYRPRSTISCRHLLSDLLNRLAGSGLASEGIIVGVDFPETGRPGFTAYGKCLAAVGGPPPYC